MSFETVFVENSIAESKVTQSVLSSLPNAKHVTVQGRTFHKIIVNEIVKTGLPKNKGTFSADQYETEVVKQLVPRFPAASTKLCKIHIRLITPLVHAAS